MRARRLWCRFFGHFGRRLVSARFHPHSGWTRTHFACDWCGDEWDEYI